VSTPEDALARAREQAARRRAEGIYSAEDLAPPPVPPDAVSGPQLMDWAVIEPDVGDVRSTRRLGAPVTALKQGLIRLLAQYHAQLTAQQTRFNVALLARVRRLEEQVEDLRRELDRERDRR
jgi:hypothetical protein